MGTDQQLQTTPAGSATPTPASAAADLGWLGLVPAGSDRWDFELTAGLSRLDNKFYGGTGVAVAVASMEAATGRRALWVAVQFVASAATGDAMHCTVEVPAAGRRSSQVQVRGWSGDRLVFSAIGSAGDDRPGPLEVQFGSPPDVPPPAECAPWSPLAMFRHVDAPWGAEERPGWLGVTDTRVTPSGSLWMRLTDRQLSRPALGFLADVIPSGVVRAAGRIGAGTSLDNTVRFGATPVGEWVLVDVDPHMISGGYVHGAARLWSEDGQLVGVASQTATLALLD